MVHIHWILLFTYSVWLEIEAETVPNTNTKLATNVSALIPEAFKGKRCGGVGKNHFGGNVLCEHLILVFPFLLPFSFKHSFFFLLCFFSSFSSLFSIPFWKMERTKQTKRWIKMSKQKKNIYLEQTRSADWIFSVGLCRVCFSFGNLHHQNFNSLKFLWMPVRCAILM